MHHLAKVSFSKIDQLPYHAECACGTAGDFASPADARNYLAGHLARLQGINSAELVDETSAPLSVPQEDAAPQQEQEEKPGLLSKIGELLKPSTDKAADPDALQQEAPAKAAE